MACQAGAGHSCEASPDERTSGEEGARGLGTASRGLGPAGKGSRGEGKSGCSPGARDL